MAVASVWSHEDRNPSQWWWNQTKSQNISIYIESLHLQIIEVGASVVVTN